MRIALAGNPNSGKTSLFNALTGSQQHVGNYPGVTVEKREGTFRAHGKHVEVVDLPGTYSLSSYTPEEKIAQRELLSQTIDLVVVVIDQTLLSRSLMFLTQLMQLRVRLVLCLNMSDEGRRSGQQLDLAQLERLLGIPVVETAAHQGQGLPRLREAIWETGNAPLPERRLVFDKRFERALDKLGERLLRTEVPTAHHEWIATKLLLGQKQEVSLTLSNSLALADAGLASMDTIFTSLEPLAIKEREIIQAESGRDIALFVAESYAGFVNGLIRQVVVRPPREDARALSDAIDAIFAHRVFGFPVFLAVMYAIFWFTFTVGEYPMAWIEHGFEVLGQWIGGFWPVDSSSALRSLLVDGIIAGVGGVVVFLPNIILLFFCLSLLEDTGYMARAAYLMDRLMHRFGLHGRSFVPMMVGFGCSVPGIMATRTLEHEHDRLTTMMVLPLFSCGARLTIWLLLIPAFFSPGWRAPILWLIYLIGILLALFLALILRRTLFRGEEAPFVMELPPYRLPTVRAVLTRMGQRAWLYVRKAGTIILAISVLIWLMATYPKATAYDAEATPEQRVSADLQASVAGHVGRTMEPLLKPLGLDWRVGTALLGAFAAKEVFVAQLGIIYSIGDAEKKHSAKRLRDKLNQTYTPAAAFALMLFLLIATPCLATLAITRRESGSWRWALLQFGGLTVIGYALAFSFFQVSRLF